MITILLRLLGDEAAPVSPVWGALNAVLNGMTLIAVAYIARRGRQSPSSAASENLSRPPLERPSRAVEAAAECRPAPSSKSNTVPTLESTIRRAAAVSAICSELEVCMELWRLTGYAPGMGPPRAMWGPAIWDALRVAEAEGWAPGFYPSSGVYDDEAAIASAKCGVDVFLQTPSDGVRTL